jgi:hypothetical protein
MSPCVRYFLMHSVNPPLDSEPLAEWAGAGSPACVPLRIWGMAWIAVPKATSVYGCWSSVVFSSLGWRGIYLVCTADPSMGPL